MNCQRAARPVSTGRRGSRGSRDSTPPAPQESRRKTYCFRGSLHFPTSLPPASQATLSARFRERRMPTREDAWRLLCEYTASESLRKHMLAVEACVPACAYVRPSKSILDLEVDSVKRRMKDKLFAKGVSREDMRKGAEELGVALEEHIAFSIRALREHADVLGLRGSL